MSRWLQVFGNTDLATMSLAPRSDFANLLSSKVFRLTAVLSLVLLGLFTLLRTADLDWQVATDRFRIPNSHYGNPASLPSDDESVVDWSRFAYGQYVTNSLYLCNSVMFFAKLHELGSRADRVMMYPFSMLPDPEANEASDESGRLIIKARDRYAVKLVPITVTHKSNNDPTWADSFTKLLSFNQTQYDRVLTLDSDSTILQNMDELFLLPPVPVALPRAYWLEKGDHTYSSQLLLVQPSAEEFARVQKKVDSAGHNDYDMEIVNRLYGGSALIIPHRPYTLLTGEFREKVHTQYLGSPDEIWDPVAVFNEAKFIHFSDFPVPKPWLPISDEIMTEHQPPCESNKEGEQSCAARDMWNGFYQDFKQRQTTVCESRATILR